MISLLQAKQSVSLQDLLHISKRGNSGSSSMQIPQLTHFQSLGLHLYHSGGFLCLKLLVRGNASCIPCAMSSQPSASTLCQILHLPQLVCSVWQFCSTSPWNIFHSTLIVHLDAYHGLADTVVWK